MKVFGAFRVSLCFIAMSLAALSSSTDAQLIDFASLSGPKILGPGSSNSYTCEARGPGVGEGNPFFNYHWEVISGNQTLLSGTGSHRLLRFHLNCQAGILRGPDGFVLMEQNSCGCTSIFVRIMDGAKEIRSNLLELRCNEGRLPGARGDPHFATWRTGARYDFHGECDLVLLQNAGFDDNQGMDIHIRTKIQDHWSYIERAAVRIGNDVLEVTGGEANETVFWVNGVANVELPLTFAGYPLQYQQESGKVTRLYSIDLGSDEQISIKTFKKFVDVAISNGSSDHFARSLGLMGSFESGAMVGRNALTIIEDPDSFGMEWQVLPTEPQLFQKVDGPQYPEKCRMPQMTTSQRRLLRGPAVISKEDAHLACSNAPDAYRDMCVFDVLATNDVEMAGAY